MSNVGVVLTGFDRNDTRGHVMVAVVWTLVPLATTTVILRMYCRLYLSKNTGIDDWMACWSMLLVIVTGSVQTYMTRHGLGVHKEFLDDEQRRYYNMLFYVNIVFYISALYSIKMHVLLQYLRLFSVKMRKLTIWVMGVVAFYGTASIMISIFKCNPIAGFWDPRLGARCIPTMPNWYLNAIGNIITDIIIFALPLRVLWRLNLDRTTRLSLVGIFGLGFFTVCLSLIRLNFLDILKGDETYQNVTPASWTIAELCSGMIVSCAICLRPLLRHNQFDDLEAAKASLNSKNQGAKILSGTSTSSGGGATNIDTAVITHHRTNSTTGLTKEFGSIEESISPTNEGRQRRGSCDSGSGTDGASLPIQGSTTKSGRYTSQSQRGSRDGANSPRDIAADEQSVELRLWTHKTVKAVASPSTFGVASRPGPSE